MITNSIFDKYSTSTISAMSSNRLLAVFGASQGMPELAEMASSVSTERSVSYQCEVMVDDVSIDVTQKTKPGLTLPVGSVIRMVKDTPFSEIPDPKTNLRGRLIGVLSTSVRNFECNPLQPCPECKGDAKCPTCAAKGLVECSSCMGDGQCTLCGGRGTEFCSACDGDGKCLGCDGTGEVECEVCYGSGGCDVCDGSGDCPKCEGSSECQTCFGSGHCQDCYGDGRVTCKRCNGDGTETCGDCSGTGDYYMGRCRNCNGKGKISFLGLHVDCETCGGTGRYRVTCRRCGGDGKVKCPKCKGRGSFRCRTCKGEGKCSDCLGSGDCRACHGHGTCGKCRGAKICLRCNGRGNFWCRDCNRHDGKCVTCEGTGSIACAGCEGRKTCSNCTGKGKVTCPSCDGSRQCVECGASGNVTCKTCEGQGCYQTYEEYTKESRSRSYRNKDHHGVFKSDEVVGERLYTGTYRKWMDIDRLEIDDSENVISSVVDEDLAKEMIAWMDGVIADAGESKFTPYKAYCKIYKVRLITVFYNVGNTRYSFSIGGEKHTVHYDKVPGKISYGFRKFKKFLGIS